MGCRDAHGGVLFLKWSQSTVIKEAILLLIIGVAVIGILLVVIYKAL